MSVHSQDSDNEEELGAIGGNKPISRQVSPFSRPSSVVLMESLLKQQREFMQQQQENMRQQQENMRQQQEQMQQQQQELMHNITSRMDTIKDQSDTTNSTLADLSRSQTDISARSERLERASPDLNPVELRTNPGDGNFVFHAVPPQVATRPSIISDIDKETETSFRPLTSVSRSLLELNRPPVLRRSERIRNRIMNTRGSKWNNIPFWATLSSC